MSIQTEREVEQPVPRASTAVGIDMGITRFATLSDGTFYAPLNSFKKHAQRLARYQRRMSRSQIQQELAQSQKESAKHAHPHQ